jgi:hypothetical protein
MGRHCIRGSHTTLGHGSSHPYSVQYGITSDREVVNARPPLDAPEEASEVLPSQSRSIAKLGQALGQDRVSRLKEELRGPAPDCRAILFPMANARTGTLHGTTITLDAPVPALDGHRVRVEVEDDERATSRHAPEFVSAADVVRSLIERLGPWQGESETELRRSLSTSLRHPMREITEQPEGSRPPARAC